MDQFFQTFLKWRQVQGKKDTWMDMMNQEVSEFRTNLKYLAELKTSPDTQSEIEMFALSAETFLQDYLRYLYETNDENSRRSLSGHEATLAIGTDVFNIPEMNETEDRKSLGDRIKANLERLKGGHTLWEECNVSQKKAMGELAAASEKFDQNL